MFTLEQLKIGESAVIESLNQQDDSSLRLAEMGLVPGEKITLLRKAPLGDPLEVRLMNYNLCLRKDQARSVLLVEPEPPKQGKPSLRKTLSAGISPQKKANKNGQNKKRK